MDREPSKLLDEAAELIAKASADTTGQAAQRASQATTLSLIVMLAVCAASVVGALLFSRSVVRTNANSVAGDPAKRRPGGTNGRRGQQLAKSGRRIGQHHGRVPSGQQRTHGRCPTCSARSRAGALADAPLNTSWPRCNVRQNVRRWGSGQPSWAIHPADRPASRQAEGSDRQAGHPAASRVAVGLAISAPGVVASVRP